MATARLKPADIDAYIAAFSPEVQAILDLHFPSGRPGSPPPANSVIYTENFSGGGNALNAKAPTTGAGAWIANPIATANGVLTADGGSAVLRFDPIPNKTYTVSLDFNYSSGTTDGWFGLGFTSVSPWVTSTASTAASASPTSSACPPPRCGPGSWSVPPTAATTPPTPPPRPGACA